MATYSHRPDGLVDVDVGGRALAMTEAQAQAGGAVPALPPQPGTPPPMANPYSAIGPNAVAGPGGGNIDVLNNPAAREEDSASFGHAWDAIKKFATTPTHTEYGDTHGQKPAPYVNPFAPTEQSLKTEAPTPPKPGAEVPRETEGLTRIDPRGGGQELSPQAQYFGQQGQGRIVQTSKGGDMRASFTRRPGEELAPGVKEYADSLDPAAMASQRETLTTNAAIARDNAVASQIDATKQAEGELEQQRQQVAQNRAALQQKLDIVDRREREAADATPQTRREVLQSRGALAGVMSGLSIALGGWVHGLRGGENPGLKIVNDSIESEISSQRAKWEASKDKVGMARSDFGQAMQLYGDPNMAEADMRMRALTLAANMANAYKTQGDNQEWLANQQQVSQQLSAQAAAEKQKWKNLADGQVVQENYVYKPPTYAQVGGAPQMPKAQQERMDKARDRLVRMPDGSYGYVSNEKQQTKVQDQIDGRSDLQSKLQRMLQLAKGSELIVGSAEQAEYDSLASAAKAQGTVLHGQGAMSAGDQANIEQGTPGSGLTVKDRVKAIETTISHERASMNRTIGSSVFQDPDAMKPHPYASGNTSSTFKPGLGQ